MENDRKIIDSLGHFNGFLRRLRILGVYNPLGEDYSSVVNTHFVLNFASTIDFPYENVAGLLDFAILGNNKLE
jgi:hypothetical protein